jgi:hypothetical protein
MPGLKGFFLSAYGDTEGYMCIASRKKSGQFQERFFKFPEDFGDVAEFVRSKTMVENVYFCPQLLTEKKRDKKHVGLVQCVWSDLDDCHPDNLHVQPSISLETSPGRYQAIWTLDKPVDAETAEAISRRIAYGHAQEGSDRSGWDLTQLLRVPGTRNFKYGDAEPPYVQVLVWDPELIYSVDDFYMYPQVEGYEYLDIPFPDLTVRTGQEVLEDVRHKINGAAFTLFHRELAEGADRSALLFRLEMYCFEALLSMAETFQVCRDASCNKFDEDIRLWKDICRARARFDTNRKQSSMPPSGEISLLSDSEKTLIKELPPTFVDRYIEWAKTVGDAAPQYHVAGAFVALSSVLAGSIKLPTSFGTVQPNVWFLLLADTTLTRKSTAMDLAMDLIMEVDESILMATDGSLEGLTTALSARSGQPSVFLRDEFTGLVDQMHKKDYMAGMPEFFAKIYDGKTQKRLLRKEEIIVRDPRLIIFGGGIKSKMTRILSFEHVESGFLPRFVIITAESDISRVKPLGPPVALNIEGRDRILAELRDINQRHSSNVPISVNGKVVGMTRQAQDIKMSQDAWHRFNILDQTLSQIGLDAGEMADVVVPTNARLAASMLKCAMLLAAARTEEGPVEVTEYDILKAASFGDQWRRYAQEIVLNVGKSEAEHKITLVLNAIQKKQTMTRSRVMQTYHLTAKEMSEIENTLVNRGLITKGGEGRGISYNTLLQET